LSPLTTKIDHTEPPIGILAGWGDFPVTVAETLLRQGRQVAVVGIIDHADPRLEQLSHHFGWIGMGGIGRAIRLFRRWGVERAAMAGKLHKVLLYQPGWWLKHRPDWKCIQAFYPQLFTGTADRKDDTLLIRVVEAFAAEGIVLEPATDFAPELLIAPGHIAGRRLTTKQHRDALFGWEAAKGMGGMDIGQTVCVKDQAVIAVEAIEGTDLCIQRAGELCTVGGFSVVKVAKPDQDMRFDVPTVGIRTLETIAKAGGQVLVIEAGRTIVLGNRHFSQTAEQLRISVIALENEAANQAAA